MNQEIQKSQLLMNKGSPKHLNEESEIKIIPWIDDQCQKQKWPTLSNFKNKVLEELENMNSSFTPNSHFYYDLQQKFFKDKYIIKLASPLEFQRYQVSNDIIIQYFENLKNFKIQDIDLSLIINIDETG